MNKRIVVLASGLGTNFVALAETIRKKKLKAEIVALLSDNPEANALLVSLSLGIRPITLHHDKNNREALNRALDERLNELSPHLIVTAGYMKLLPDLIVQKYENKIINIHPSLLPAFQGMHAIKRAYEYGVKVTGCTTHFVDSSLDGGRVIMQSVVKIKPGMKEEDLRIAIQKEEHKILPKSVQYFIEDRLVIHGRDVKILEE